MEESKPKAVKAAPAPAPLPSKAELDRRVPVFPQKARSECEVSVLLRPEVSEEQLRKNTARLRHNSEIAAFSAPNMMLV